MAEVRSFATGDRFNLKPVQPKPRSFATGDRFNLKPVQPKPFIWHRQQPDFARRSKSAIQIRNPNPQSNPASHPPLTQISTPPRRHSTTMQLLTTTPTTRVSSHVAPWLAPLLYPLANR
ncbi:MAG: hypothetical protein EAZ61_14920, partial [Oscillatoriales cyanobacterium]